MRVLFLGPETSPIYRYLAMLEKDVLRTDLPLYEHVAGRDIIVSHGYRHKVPAHVLARTRAVNCHISFLPWNRGADPNLWSWVDDTPKGVSIHVMSEEIDDGPWVFKRPVDFHFGNCCGEQYSVNDEVVTLRTSYDRLQRNLLSVFSGWWFSAEAFVHSDFLMIPRTEYGQGSVHTTDDRAKVQHLLTEGWDTPVKKLIGALKAA